jgi:coenzyme PQQ precursor peptide PqqA
MPEQWTKPAFEEVCVNGECTAYAAGIRDEPAPVRTLAVPAPGPADALPTAADEGRS